jgi:hypothetical protein
MALFQKLASWHPATSPKLPHRSVCRRCGVGRTSIAHLHHTLIDIRLFAQTSGRSDGIAPAAMAMSSTLLS